MFETLSALFDSPQVVAGVALLLITFVVWYEIKGADSNQ
jgi:hypothetical protein